MKNLLLQNFNPDWQQLRIQKLTLLILIEEAENNDLTKRKDDLTGILHLIDYIQDQGVGSGLWAEGKVFGFFADTIDAKIQFHNSEEIEDVTIGIGHYEEDNLPRNDDDIFYYVENAEEMENLLLDDNGEDFKVLSWDFSLPF